MTSDIPNGAMPKEGEGEGEKLGSSGEDKSEKERQGSYDLVDGDPNSEVVGTHVHDIYIHVYCVMHVKSHYNITANLHVHVHVRTCVYIHPQGYAAI